MPQEIRLWGVEEGDQLARVEGVELDYESRLEDWLEQDISILGLDLLVIGRQVQTDFGGAIDLLCIDPAGDLVVVELKKHRTSREVTSQALEYASWVRDLGGKRVTETANEYLRPESNLEAAFSEAFDAALPEVLNGSHQILIVAAELDQRSERIIRYLSDEYGVNINAINFQLFQLSDGQEALGRVFLLEPGEVDYRSRTRQSSKRRPYPSRDELHQRAVQAGVGETYEGLVDFFSNVFPTTETRMESLAFHGRWDRLASSYSVFMNLYPDRGESGQGVEFEFYTYRVADAWGIAADRVRNALPSSAAEWRYADKPDSDQQWRWDGHKGMFRTLDEAKPLVELLLEAEEER